MRKAIIINLSIFVISLLLYWGYAIYDTFAYQFDPLAWAQTAVAVGTPKEDATAALETKAWGYQSCLGDQLFFFGSHDYDKTFVVIVSYTDEHVSQIFAEEAYFWQMSYGSLLDRSQFD